MEDLLLSDHTRAHINGLLKAPPHAILLAGPVGMGKRTIAMAIANVLTSATNITVMEPDEKGTIAIETIRTLYIHTRSRQESWQVVVIDQAQAMGIEAQNALLKLLEEPRAGVTFILTAPSSDALLPTITSRVQTIAVPRVGQKAIHALALKINPAIQPQELAQLLFVAAGRPGVVARLLTDEQAFARHKQIMQQAKHMLTASPYERLCQVASLTKNREDAVNLLEAMARMLQAQLLRDPNEQFVQLADGIQLCLARLAQNGNPRAQLTALFAGH